VSLTTDIRIIKLKGNDGRIWMGYIDLARKKLLFFREGAKCGEHGLPKLNYDIRFDGPSIVRFLLPAGIHSGPERDICVSCFPPGTGT